MYKTPVLRRSRAAQRKTRWPVILFVLAACMVWFFSRPVDDDGQEDVLVLSTEAPASQSLGAENSEKDIEYSAAEEDPAGSKDSTALYWRPRPSFSQRNDPSCNDGSGPLLPPPIDMTVYTTTKGLDAAQVTAIRSWLALGADVIVMIDSLEDSNRVPFCLVSEQSGQAEPWRLRIVETPKPRGDSGAPHMDLVFEEGERSAKTKWLAYVNGDIVLPRNFAKLATLKVDKMFFGGRLDCRTPPTLKTLPSWVASFEDFERFALAPCWPHGSGGKDFYVYQKGFWKRHKIVLPPFFIGKFVWDNWIVNVTAPFAVDTSPTLAIGHFSHNGEYVWDKSKQTKHYAQKEIEFNRALINCTRALFQCLPKLSVYHAAEQLCPIGFRIQPMVAHSTKVYDRAVADLRDTFKPHRRIYQPLAVNGTSPSFWFDYTGTGEWGRRLGCTG